MGIFIRGFIWDIPVLIFAYVLFWGAETEEIQQVKSIQASSGAFAAVLTDGSVATWGDPDSP